MSDYFYAHESKKCSSFMIPKELFTNSHYAQMDVHSKVLYGILLDILKFGNDSTWIDESNRVYINCTRLEVQDILKIGKDKCTALFQELTLYGLIEEVSQRRQAKRIYLKKFDKA